MREIAPSLLRLKRNSQVELVLRIRIRDPLLFQPLDWETSGSEMKILGSRINIPDPQHCIDVLSISVVDLDP
jgi:hypothetical protein